MKSSSLVLGVVIVAVLGGLGWLARSWLRGEPATLPTTGPSNVATNPDRASTPPAQTPDAASSTSAPEAQRQEEMKKPTVPPPAEATGAPGSIVGRVLNPQSEPVSGVEVELRRGPTMGLQLQSLTSPTGLVVQTGNDGRYRFPTVDPNDDYLVYATHAEYGDCEAGPVVVLAGQEKTVADIRLRVGVHIEGRVMEKNAGRPVPGATVTLSNAMDRIRRFRPGPLKDRLKELDLEPIEVKTVTDADGHYEFASVPFDTFEITAEAQNLARMSKTSQGNFLGGSARDHKIDFELGPAATISGSVVDEDRNGIEGAKVSATLANSSFRCEVTALTDAGGRFALQQLSDGQYFLGVEREGYTSANRAQVQAGATDVQIEMRVQGSVTGVVVDEETGAPIPAFELAVLQSYKGRGPATTKENLEFQDSAGRFEIKNLDPGRYTIQATVVDYADSVSDEFEVERGQLTSGVRVAVNRGGSVAGIVVDRAGKPVKNALVKLRENGTKDNPVHQLFGQLAGAGKEPQTRTGEDGSFRIDLVVPETYQLYFRHNKFAPLTLDDVPVAKGDVKQMGKVELSRGGKVTGHAYDLDGQPLSGATILAVSKTSDTHQARTNNDGYYELDQLPNGDYTITINNYQSNPPINALKQLVLAKNSKAEAKIIDGDELNIDLRLRDNSK